MENPLEMVSEKARMAVIEELTNSLKKLQEENNKLKKELEKRDRQIEIIATQGLDIRRIHPIEEIEEYLGYEKGYLQALYEKDETEYLKSLFHRYTILIDEKLRAMRDQQMDVNGDFVADMLKKAVSFFFEHPTTSTLTADDIPAYEENVRKLEKAIDLLWQWKVASADLQNFNEAISHGIIHYAIKSLSKTARQKTELTINPEQELERPNEQEQAITKMQEEISYIKTAISELAQKITPLENTPAASAESTVAAPAATTPTDLDIPEIPEREEKTSKSKKGR